MSRLKFGAVLLSALSFAACSDTSPTADVSFARAGYDAPGVHRQYGAPVSVGAGQARSYVVLDQKSGGAPLEIGIALDERALTGLPEGMPPGEGMAMGTEYVLPLPQQNPTPYRTIVLDWNPNGHEPPQLYGKPHFDFHFYMISNAERLAIDPATDPSFVAKAVQNPGAYMAPGYIPPQAPPQFWGVPRMGTHYVDPTSPEFSPAGFSRTFIYGAWNGKLIFAEPMITREFLLTKPDVVINVPVPAQVETPGYYPTAYRVTYDAQAKEYRVALTALQAR